jgi:hypothetical protein
MSYENPKAQELGDALDLTQVSGGDSTDSCGCPAPKPPEEGIWLEEE